MTTRHAIGPLVGDLRVALPVPEVVAVHAARAAAVGATALRAACAETPADPGPAAVLHAVDVVAGPVAEAREVGAPPTPGERSGRAVVDAVVDRAAELGVPVRAERAGWASGDGRVGGLRSGGELDPGDGERGPGHRRAHEEPATAGAALEHARGLAHQPVGDGDALARRARRGPAPRPDRWLPAHEAVGPSTAFRSISSWSPPQVSSEFPTYWWTRWPLAHNESDRAHGGPNPKVFGVPFQAAIQTASSSVVVRVVVDRGLVEDARAQAAVHAGDVTLLVEARDPAVHEAAHRGDTPGVAAVVGLHVEVDRAADREPGALGLGHRVVGGQDPLHRGSEPVAADLRRAEGDAGSLETDVDREDAPTLRPHRVHPRRRVEREVGARPVLTPDVDADGRVRRRALPHGHRGGGRRLTRVEAQLGRDRCHARSGTGHAEDGRPERDPSGPDSGREALVPQRVAGTRREHRHRAVRRQRYGRVAGDARTERRPAVEDRLSGAESAVPEAVVAAACKRPDVAVR